MSMHKRRRRSIVFALYIKSSVKFSELYFHWVKSS